MDDRTKPDLFCIATFCLVEEVYLSSAIIVPIRKRRNADKGFSDIELITVVLVGEADGQRKAKMLYVGWGVSSPAGFLRCPNGADF